MTWRFSAEYANGRSNETSPAVHARPSPAAVRVRPAVASPIQTSDPRTPRRRSERRATLYFQTSARTRATPATRCVRYRMPAAVSGRSHATIPDTRRVAIAASNTRLPSLRGTEAMLVRGRWQTARVREHDLLVLSEDRFNAETRLDDKTPTITPAGSHYVRTHFPIPTGPRSILIDAISTTASISFDEIRALPARSMVVTLECAGNGRRFLEPKVPGGQWGLGAGGTATWTGAALRGGLRTVAIPSRTVEVLFRGADEGMPKDLGKRIGYERSLPLDDACGEDVLVAYLMEGAPIPREHGGPPRRGARGGAA